jgi:AraC-like DNA-binding protein
MGYVETPPPPAAARVVACLWRQEVTAPEQRVVPDGCVDVVRLASGALFVAGADTGPLIQPLTPGDVAEGVRLRPGAAPSVLGVDATALTDRRVPLADLGLTLPPGVPLVEALPLTTADPDPLALRAGVLLAEADARVATVARDLGLSERQLRRRVLSTVGYGPKTLARVARLRRLTRTRGDLATRALAAGYASQAHMGDEVRRLTGLTPATYLAA